MITTLNQRRRSYIEFWRGDIHSTLVHLWMSMLQSAHRLVALDRETRLFFGLERTDIGRFLVATESDIKRISSGLPYPFRPARRLVDLLKGEPTTEEKQLATECAPRAILDLQLLWSTYLNVTRSVLDRDERARVLCGLTQVESTALRSVSIATLQAVAAAGPYVFSASESLRGELQAKTTLTRRELIRRTAADLGVIARHTK